MSVLDEIVSGVREDVDARQAVTSLADVQAAARDARPALDALAALRAPGVGVIAEVKRRSPSKGELAEITDPAARTPTWPPSAPPSTCRCSARTSWSAATRCTRPGRTARTSCC